MKIEIGQKIKFFILVVPLYIILFFVTSCEVGGIASNVIFAKKRVHNPNIPIAIPFDLTSRGNAVEVDFEINEKVGNVGFYLIFCYDDPRKSRYQLVEMVKSFFPTKPYTEEELSDNRRVGKLVGQEEKLDRALHRPARYSGIKTPIRLIITKFSDGKKEMIFDEVSEPELHSWGSSYDKKIKSPILVAGKYRVRAEAVKDSPEFSGTEIIFFGGSIRGKY